MLLKKQTIVDKRTRKNCYKKIVEERFDFKENEEFAEYKYVCGQCLDSEEWQICLEKNTPDTFEQWERNIKSKYEMKSKSLLIEFENYLSIGISSGDAIKECCNIVLAATLSAALASFFTELVNELRCTSNHSIIGAVIVIIVVLGGTIYLTKRVANYVGQAILKQQMYMKYRNIIKYLIDHK